MSNVMALRAEGSDKKRKKSEKPTISAWKWGRVRAARSKWGEEDVAFEKPGGLN